MACRRCLQVTQTDADKRFFAVSYTIFFFVFGFNIKLIICSFEVGASNAVLVIV